MKDIVPEMLENIMTDFDQGVRSSPLVSRVKGLLDEGKATYDDVNSYSLHLGEMLSGTLQKYITPDTLPDGKMYYNIADRILGETMTKDHELISEVATQVQQSLNEAGGLGIKALTPPVNNDRIKGLVDKVSNADQFADAEWILGEPILNFSQSVVDDTVKLNADFQGKAGLRPVIVRRTDSKPCDWCKNLAGTYTYPEVPAEVYMRHRSCQCTVEYRPGNKRAQNVWSKKWSDETTEELLEVRKTIGLKKDQQAYDVRGIKKPKRPSFRDYPNGTTDENYIRDRAAYKRNRETYDELMNQQVDRSLKREFKYNTPERVLAAGRERGIEIDPLLIGGENDLRAFDEMFESYDELRRKYPQAMKYEYDYEGRKVPAGINRIMKSEGDSGEWYYAGFEGDTLRLGDGMLESYEDNMRKYLESITEGHFSKGTGTYKNLFNHEFGHNVDAYIQNTIRSGKEVTQYLPKLTEYQDGLKKIYADYGPPSEYGGASLEEFFAETFSAYEGGEQTELTRAFGKFLEGWL